MKAVDQPRAALLAELALDCARQVLRPGGDLLLKMFQGAGFDPLLAELRAAFARVVVRKPQASRPRSREVYLLARNYRLV
jgi:23S rRNA (uridine2552-2'-O)-methyltransferase